LNRVYHISAPDVKGLQLNLKDESGAEPFFEPAPIEKISRN